MKTKGFTLIELLAVIVILAVIALIATPIILGIIDDTKKSAFKDSAYGISQAAKNAFVEIMYSGNSLEEIIYTYTDGVETSNPSGHTLNYEGDKPQNGQVSLTKEGKVALALHDGKYCVTKGYTDAEITIEEEPWADCDMPVAQFIDRSGANIPVLATGMTPVVWNGTSWVTASNTDDFYKQNWYDYNNQKWANAKTADGSMWVWIPRYVYKISSGWHKNYSGKNMINPSKLANNMGIDFNTGEEAATGTTTITKEYIVIEPNTTYTITRPVNSGIMGGRFYDANKTYLGSSYASLIAGNVLTVTFTTPSNAYYMKFVDQANTTNSGYQLEKSSSATAFEAYKPAGEIVIQFSQGIDDNWNIDGIGAIDTGTSASASNNKYTNHPAFTFGGSELLGIWVAKFEATATEGVANGYTSDNSCSSNSDNVTTKTIKLVPNATSWRCISVDNVFVNIRNMETKSIYGWGTTGSGIDTHLIKNSEWGAVAYLSKSQYGKNNEENYINNSQTFTTGCGGNTIMEGAYNGCQNAYNTSNGVKTSTTGNIYGIYDMSGGSWEYVSAYLNNGNSNLTQATNITSAASKYKDAYTVGGIDDQATNYSLTSNFKGDGIWETSNSGANGSYSWFADFSNMPNTTFPWFVRGARFNSGSNAGLFTFHNGLGGVHSSYGFRPVLLVGSGL